jgi:hypothetical protein
MRLDIPAIALLFPVTVIIDSTFFMKAAESGANISGVIPGGF